MIQLINIDLWTYLQSYLAFAILSGITVIIGTYILSAFLSVSLHKNWNQHFGKRLPSMLIFYIYFFFVAGITLLSREPGSRVEVNLKIFGTITDSAYGNRYVIENILLFIPFGVLFPILWNRINTAFKCLLAGFLFSLLIEVIQFITKRGYFQVDDMIFNTLGTLLGYVILSCLKSLKKWVLL